RFSVVNDSKYPVTIKMTYVDDEDGVLQPSGFLYVADIPPDGKTYTYTVLKTLYYFEWWSGDNVYLKPTSELTYDKASDGLLLEPFFGTLLRFQQRYNNNPPQGYFDWLDRWGLDWNYIYHY
ncbi:MAG: hypothetical protein KKC55_14865, partial [Gammaproteobacteria bacterium]|nr:hypothetical protein [Gammaproteobacteria bacterium]